MKLRLQCRGRPQSGAATRSCLASGSVTANRHGTGARSLAA